jgi:tetratricopeptide (TPR) repeat protein
MEPFVVLVLLFNLRPGYGFGMTRTTGARANFRYWQRGLFWAALIFSPRLYALEWMSGSFQEAQQRAKASHRWILVDFYATWCGPCHEMDEKVWSRDDVGQALSQSFVTIRRDGEAGEGEALVKRFHIVGYPTMLVLDAEAREVDRLMGAITPRDLIDTLRHFREGNGTTAELERRLSAFPNDDALRLEVATRKAMRGDAEAPIELDRVVKGDPENKAKRAAAALLTLGKYYHLRGAKDYARAIECLTELERRFPHSDEAAEVPYNLGIAYHALGRDTEARTALERWIAAAPKDFSRYNAYAWLCFKHNFDRSRGIEIAKKGLTIDPNEDGLWDTLGELYAVTGRLADARDAEQRAVRLKPQSPYYQAQLRKFGGK